MRALILKRVAIEATIGQEQGSKIAKKGRTKTTAIQLERRMSLQNRQGTNKKVEREKRVERERERSEKGEKEGE